MESKVSIVWFRLDLRLADNPALQAALKHSEAVVPVFIWSPHEEFPWAPGAASRWWLHHSLERLHQSLRNAGSQLVLRSGDSVAELQNLISATGAQDVYWNRRYEPAALARDAQVAESLQSAGVRAHSFAGNLLHDPAQVATREQNRFRVFTPFWKRISAELEVPNPLPFPERVPLPDLRLSSVPINDLGLLPGIDWADGIRDVWTPGEQGAQKRLEQFVEGGYRDYKTARNRPDWEGVSRLSPHLHFGEISVRQIYHALNDIDARSASERESISAYVTELGWREFAHYVLFHYPQTSENPLRREFDRLRGGGTTADDERLFKVWQKGLTGYPIVDAGMRQLWRTGWMHNRVRMIVASFLTKDLFINWRQGARWFWDTLVDADLANNTLGWQWAAGCGADAAPYYRIFNPELQGERFDPNGDYVREWVPELSLLPSKWIHRPWKAPDKVLESAAVQLGVTYPEPIIDHLWARRRALDAFDAVRNR